MIRFKFFPSLTWEKCCLSSGIFIYIKFNIFPFQMNIFFTYWIMHVDDTPILSTLPFPKMYFFSIKMAKNRLSTIIGQSDGFQHCIQVSMNLWRGIKWIKCEKTVIKLFFSIPNLFSWIRELATQQNRAMR